MQVRGTRIERVAPGAGEGQQVPVLIGLQVIDLVQNGQSYPEDEANGANYQCEDIADIC